MQARGLPKSGVTLGRGRAGVYCLHAPRRSWSHSMQNTARDHRATDHPTRDPADHANLDPRRSVKHPKIAARPRPGNDRPRG
jgi:hypothetical protein